MATVSAISIREPYIDLILSGKKQWEIRSRPTAKRGLIALIKSGSSTVVGTARLVAVIELTASSAKANAARMGMLPAAAAKCEGRFAWVLSDIVALQESIPYKHPVGAVKWVTLNSQVSDRVLAARAHTKARTATAIKIKSKRLRLLPLPQGIESPYSLLELGEYFVDYDWSECYMAVWGISEWIKDNLGPRIFPDVPPPTTSPRLSEKQRAKMGLMPPELYLEQMNAAIQDKQNLAVGAAYELIDFSEDGYGVLICLKGVASRASFARLSDD